VQKGLRGLPGQTIVTIIVPLRGDRTNHSRHMNRPLPALSRTHTAIVTLRVAHHSQIAIAEKKNSTKHGDLGHSLVSDRTAQPKIVYWRGVVVFTYK